MFGVGVGGSYSIGEQCCQAGRSPKAECKVALHIIKQKNHGSTVETFPRKGKFSQDIEKHMFNGSKARQDIGRGRSQATEFTYLCPQSSKPRFDLYAVFSLWLRSFSVAAHRNSMASPRWDSFMSIIICCSSSFSSASYRCAPTPHQCIYVYVYIYIYIYIEREIEREREIIYAIYMYIYAQVYVYACVYVSIYLSIYLSIYVYIYIYIYIYRRRPGALVARAQSAARHGICRAGKVHIDINSLNNLKTSRLGKVDVRLAFNGNPSLSRKLVVKLLMLMWICPALICPTEAPGGRARGWPRAGCRSGCRCRSSKLSFLIDHVNYAYYVVHCLLYKFRIRWNCNQSRRCPRWPESAAPSTRAPRHTCALV